MKAKYLGFALKSEVKEFSVENLVAHIKSLPVEPVKYPDFDRYYFFNNDFDDSYYLGMTLTLKSQRKQCQAEMQNGGGMKIKTEDLANRNKIIDFNFFVINKKSLKGMYVYYHQSCSVITLGDYLRKNFYSQKQSLIEAKSREIKNSNPDKDDEWSAKRARKYYKGRFEFNQLVDQRDIDKVLAEFKKVKDVEVSFSAIEFPMADGVALQDKSTTITSRFLIAVQEDVNNIAQAAKAIVNMRGFKRGKAKIVDEQDVERTIRLINAPENFGEVEFEELADKINELDVTRFYENQILVDIIGVMENVKNKRIFSSKS